MVTYRPGRLPERGEQRLEGGRYDGEIMYVAWPPPPEVFFPTERGVYRLVEHTEIPPLTADYRWEPSE